MSNYKDYPYNQVCFKASHNSYDTGVYDISITEQLDTDCRGLELDISQSSDGKSWSVAHNFRYFNDDRRQLARYLEELKNWSSENSGHDVITVHLDLKLVEDESNTSPFPEQIDQYIRDNFDENKIYQPGDLIGKRSSLAHAARTFGWPKLKELENKFIFCLTGNDVFNPRQPVKKLYAKTQPKERVCFTDNRKNKNQKPSPGQQIYFNYDFRRVIPPRSRIDEQNWTDILQGFVGNNDVITRGFLLNQKKNWDRALSAGFNILVTDEIDESWAKVGNSPFRIMTLV